ncbi:MAG: NUDIX hydrolase [Bacteroidales bacterium]|jgi:8-oxo-dGTP pyrophosphatase MutT (NUDIX family)|nr:NUDIX hydrolase [Bacteroidales bacterium]
MNSNPNFRVGVELLCKQGDKVLLMKRRDDAAVAPGVWSPPAGKAKFEEIPIQAAHRELREETGIENASLIEVNCRTMTIKSNGETAYRLYFTYLVTVSGDVVVIPNDEHSEFAWVSKEEIFSDKYNSLHPAIKELILDKVFNV